MRNIIFICFFLLISPTLIFCQHYTDRKFLEELKICKALIIGVEDPQSPNWVKFQNESSKFWNITPVKVLNFKEAKKYSYKPKYAIVEFCEVTGRDFDKLGFVPCHSGGGLGTMTTSDGHVAGGTTYPELCMFLYCMNKKGEMGLNPIVREVTQSKLSISHITEFLRCAQNQLLDSRKDVDDDKKTIKKGSIERLKDYELIVSRFVVPRIKNIIARADKPFKPIPRDDDDIKKDSDKIIKAYPYKLKMVSGNELDSLILEMPAKYAIFCVSYMMEVKTIYIMDAESGEVLYSEKYYLSTMVKDSDFKDLAKAIAKGK